MWICLAFKFLNLWTETDFFNGIVICNFSPFSFEADISVLSLNLNHEL